MTVTYALETEPDIICGECDRPLPPGSPVGEALEAMANDKPVVLTVCVYCAMGQERADGRPWVRAMSREGAPTPWLGVGFGVFWIVLAVIAAYFNHGAVAIAWSALGGFCVGGASRALRDG